MVHEGSASQSTLRIDPARPPVRPRRAGIEARRPRTDLAGRLIAVSNRVSRPAAGTAAPGGLALAISEALQTRGGTWFGWSGNLVDESRPPDVERLRHRNVDYGLLDLPAETFRGFYEGYANGVVWPVFHNRPDLCAHAPLAFEAYAAVNRAFAETIARAAGPDDTVWVQDYHFLTLARELRAAGVASAIGLFLHTPFPNVQTFRTIPEAESLARALMAFDVIGVQTRRDAYNLAECLAALGEGTVVEASGWLEARAWGERVRVAARPIGIDVDAIRRHRDEPMAEEVARYVAAIGDRCSMIGVDRLDYSKGLPQRLEAFQRLLQADPQRAADTVFTQIAPVSRGNLPAYAATRREVEAIAGRIAGTYGTLTDSPLRLLTRAYDRRAVAQLMAASDVGLVTPTADGMNLVAKEFVAVQDPDDPGVLVLSEFAGAAETMTDAVLVNPHDLDGMAAAMDEARSMPRAERRDRHRSLMQAVEDTGIARWTARCLEDLAASG